MIDLLNTVTADLQSRHLDDAATICGVAPKTIPDDTWVFCLMAVTRARGERAHAQEYLAGVQNPDVAHLHVEIAVAHGGVGGYGAAVSTAPRALVLGLTPPEPLSNACQRCCRWRQLLQSAGTQVLLKPNKGIGLEAGELTTLEQARHDDINSKIDSEPFSEAEMMFLGRVALNAEQSRKGRVWIGDVRTPNRPRTFQNWRACACECSMRH
jgi:hypothetical protein